MREWQSQSHVKHYCKYHIVFVPKYRKKSLYGSLRKDIDGCIFFVLRARPHEVRVA
jgi:putative transposase